MDKVSYALGIGIGRQLASMGAETLNIDDFAQAVKDAIAGKSWSKPAFTMTGTPPASFTICG